LLAHLEVLEEYRSCSLEKLKEKPKDLKYVEKMIQELVDCAIDINQFILEGLAFEKSWSSKQSFWDLENKVLQKQKLGFGKSKHLVKPPQLKQLPRGATNNFIVVPPGREAFEVGLPNVYIKKERRQMHLKNKETRALIEFKNQILEKFSNVRFVLFGSKAREDDQEDSDIDVLVVLDRKVNIAIEKEIFDVGFEVEIRWDVVFGIVVEESDFLNTPMAGEMPFYKNIKKQGVLI